MITAFLMRTLEFRDQSPPIRSSRVDSPQKEWWPLPNHQRKGVCLPHLPLLVYHRAHGRISGPQELPPAIATHVLLLGHDYLFGAAELRREGSPRVCTSLTCFAASGLNSILKE